MQAAQTTVEPRGLKGRWGVGMRRRVRKVRWGDLWVKVVSWESGNMVKKPPKSGRETQKEALSRVARGDAQERGARSSGGLETGAA